MSNALANVDIEIFDLSVLVNTGLKGITGVLGATDLGLHEKLQLIGSWLEFQKYFGGLRSDTVFPLLAKRALEAGGKLKISRAGHYTNISDNTTLVGTKAKKTARLQKTIQIDRVTPGHTFMVYDDDLTAFLTAGATFTIAGANTGNGTYTVGSSVISDGDSDGTSGTTITVVETIPGGMSAVGAKMTYDENRIQFIAEAVGSGYNNFDILLTVNVADATKMDVTFQHQTYPLIKYSASSLTVPMTSGDIASFNAASMYFKYYAQGVTTTLTPVVGAENVSLIVDADYIGDVGANPTGLHVFDDDMEITRIAIPEIASNTIDTALAAYADMRKDIMAVIRTPHSLDGYSAVHYRECTGIYTGTPVDTWRATMWYGGLNVKNPLDGINTNISVIGDVVGLMASKDNKNREWFAAAGSKRGKIKNALGVYYNVGAPARATEGGYMVAHGVNPVINHSSFGIVAWGNKTLQKSATLLQKLNIAECILFTMRAVKPLAESELFDPNDPESWSAMHRRIVPLLEYIKTGRGFSDYVYQGDQDVTDPNNVVINNPADLAEGKYIFRLLVKPIGAMEFIGIQIGVTNASVDFSVFDDVEL